MNNHNTHTEKELFARIAEGDEQAFRILYDNYRWRLRPALVRLTNSTDLPSDLVQEIMLRIWLYREKLPEIEHPQAYIFRIAANVAHLYLKKKLKQEAIQAISPVIKEQSAEGEASLMMKSIAEVVKAAIEALPEQRRRVYRMNRDEGMKVNAIAEVLGISVSTAKNTLLEAVKAIRGAVEKAGYLNLVILFCWSLL